MNIIKPSFFVILNDLLGEKESLYWGEVVSIENVTGFYLLFAQ